jgi:hypothetical protein
VSTAGSPPGFPERPSLTTPRRLLSHQFLAAERERLARQPGLGLAGLVLVAPVAIVLAYAIDGPEHSLLILAPISTFALPAVAMVGFWWYDWPGTSLRAPWTGLVDTVLVIVAGVALTVLGQAVVGGIDPRGIFDATPGPGIPPTFPATMPLAAAAFVAMLQLTLVSEGWPLRRFPRVPSGVAALALAWAVALVAYLLLVDAQPPPGEGLHARSGPVSGAAFGAWLVSVGVWQVSFFVVLHGWPFAEIRRRSVRLLAGNAVVIGGAWLTYLGLRDIADWEPATNSAVGGAAIAAALLIGMLFEGWPATKLPPLPGRLLKFAGIALLTALLYLLLKALADGVDWAKGEPADWVAYVGLNGIGIGVILHVAIGKRWPFGRPSDLVAGDGREGRRGGGGDHRRGRPLGG